MSEHAFNIDEVSEELKSLIIEAEFNSRWTLLEAYHHAGKAIEELYANPDNPMSKEDLVQALAGKIGRGERTLWMANKFYKTYPDMNTLPEGKNISWNKVITKYLSPPKPEKEECSHVPVVKCKDCGKVLEGYKIVKI